MPNGTPRNNRIPVYLTKEELDLLERVRAVFSTPFHEASYNDIFRAALRILGGEKPSGIFVHYTLHGPEFYPTPGTRKGRNRIVPEADMAPPSAKETTPQIETQDTSQ